MTFERARIVMEGFFGEYSKDGRVSNRSYCSYIDSMPGSTWKYTKLNRDFFCLYNCPLTDTPDYYDRWLQSMEKWIRITYSGQWRDVMTESVRDVLNGRVDHLIRYDISDPE